MRFYASLASILLGCVAGLAQAEPRLLNQDQVAALLSTSDEAFIQYRIDALVLEGACRKTTLPALPRTDFRQLETSLAGSTLRIYVQPDVIRSREVLLVVEQGQTLSAYNSCNQDVVDQLLPVLAIMSTAKYLDDSDSNQTRQAVLASHSFLTSHDPTMLMLRNDKLDSSASYVDFQLSAKHPLFSSAKPFNALNSNIADSLEQLLPGENEYFMQLYLGFTGRFSHYMGERNSSPVVGRSFNPELFYRFWTSRTNYVDAGFGHESNGQRIHTLEAFQREEMDYLADGEPALYARDSLSRGWDYLTLDWQRSWNNRWLTQFKFTHFLDKGPLQGDAEEYNLWEDGGDKLQLRRQYDGVNLVLQYNFNRSRCLLGSTHICLENVKIAQATGYSAMFEHNTTTLEMTTDFFGMPIQLWGKSGYNNNLVDYYDYTTSWGLGIELLSR